MQATVGNGCGLWAAGCGRREDPVDARFAQRTMTAATCAGAVVLALDIGWTRPGRPLLVVALLVLGPVAALTRFVDVDVRLGRSVWPVRTVDALLGVGLVLAPSGWWALILVLGTAGGLLASRLPRAAVVRTVGQLALAAGLACWIAGHHLDLRLASSSSATGRLPVLMLAVLSYAALTHVLTATGVALTVRRPVWQLLRGRGPLPPSGTVVTGLLGALVGAQLLAAPSGAVLLVVGGSLLVALRRQQRCRDADLQMYAELVRGQEQASGRSVDVSAEVVLGAAARLLGGADCELLVRHPAGPVRYAGDEYGVRERRPVTGAEFDQPWVLRVLGSPAARTGIELGRPYVAAAIGRGTPWAVLIARRPLHSREFGPADRRRLFALTHHAETWLAVSELTGWDTPYGSSTPAGLGPDAEPSLRALRDASRRLARLAQRWDSRDPVTDVITEMQSCEHAMTELLGGATGGSPLARPVEWTSTGTMSGIGR